MLTSDQPLWLAQTKLQPPRLWEDFIPRRRLVDALHAAVTSRRLTLISAPAGYGKTSLLAALASAYPVLPLAWLSLDPEDNDPTGFLNALIAALQRLNPACGATTQTVLARLTHPAAEIRRAVGVLINDILESLPAPFLLVLDDLHNLSEPAIFSALDYLLDHLPTQQFLLETSILAELTPTLCQAVTGRSDAASFLETLYHRNLFLVAVDETDDRLSPESFFTYCYHDLFADFLRQQLTHEKPDALPELHRRAAAAETIPVRAISYYLKGGWWLEAAQLIEQVGEPLLRQGWVGSLRGWIQSLPAELRETRPRLAYLLGVCALHQQAFDRGGVVFGQSVGRLSTRRAGPNPGLLRAYPKTSAAAAFTPPLGRAWEPDPLVFG